jgi:predicted dehydrogenase
VVLGIGTDRRFFPAVRELLRLTKSGELGKILHTEAHFSNKVAGTLSEWRYSLDESAGRGDDRHRHPHARFADSALAGGAPYPISTGEMLDTVAAFEAIAEGAKSDGRVQDL